MDQVATVSSSTSSLTERERQDLVVARIERLPLSRWHVKMRFIVGVATFFDAIDTLMIASVLPVLIPLWKITPTQIGFLISSGFIGQLLGTLFFGWLAEKKGRLTSLSYTVVVFAIASFLCTFSWAYAALFTFRFLQGVGLGGEVPVAATYINELAKAHGRGKFFLLYELVFAVGLVVAALLGWWIVPRYGWRVMFLVGAVVALVIPFLRRHLPESPRWLANHNRLDEAEKIVARIENEVSDNGRRELPPVRKLTTVNVQKTRLAELLQGIYRRRTLALWVMWFCAQFCNFGMVTWLPSLYTSVYKLPVPVALKYAMITQAVGLAGCVFAALFIDKIGRKPLFTVSFLWTAGFLLVLWQMGRTTPQMLLTMTSIGYLGVSAIAMSLFLYAPEIYPTRMRALGCAAGASSFRVAVFIAPVLVGIIVGRYSLPYAFLMYGCVALVGAIVTGLFATETKGRVLEEVSP